MTPAWLERALRHPEITDICINGTQGTFVDRGHGLESLQEAGLGGEVPDFWSDDEMKHWVLEQLAAAGKTWDAKFPFVDSTMGSGHRLHVAFPPLSQAGLLISIRRLASARHTREPRHERWKGDSFFPLLKEAVIRGESILISGSTGSGKTTLATDLLSFIPPHERVVALEDTPELAPAHPHFLSLVSRPPNADGFGEVTLRMLLRQTLRMRPDRIILGECRGSEVLDLLQALNTGHHGAMATLHSNSPRDALRRMELLCLLASGGTVPLVAIRELVAAGVQWVAQVRRNGAHREISELWRVEGREGDTILMRPMVKKS